MGPTAHLRLAIRGKDQTLSDEVFQLDWFLRGCSGQSRHGLGSTVLVKLTPIGTTPRRPRGVKVVSASLPASPFMRATGGPVRPDLFCRRSHTPDVHCRERFAASFESNIATSQTLNSEFPAVDLDARCRQPSSKVIVFDFGTVETEARFTKQIPSNVGPVRGVASQ